MRLDDFAGAALGYTLDGTEIFLFGEARKQNPPRDHYEASNFSNMV